MKALFHRALPWAGTVALGIAAIAVVWWFITVSNASDARDARAQESAFARANTVCGTGPLSIKAHGSSWSFGPWLEVKCKNGTTRAVKL